MKDYLPVVRALISAVLLLEDAGPDEVNPDTAARGLENIAASLLVLEKSDQQLLRGYFLEIAESEEDEVYRKIVRSVPDILGLSS